MMVSVVSNTPIDCFLGAECSKHTLYNSHVGIDQNDKNRSENPLSFENAS